MERARAKGRGSMQGPRLGSYELIRRLGEGGMAQVYLARDVRLGREVAIKVLDKQLARRAGFPERFEHEAQVAAALDHPNIVPLYDFGESNGVLFLVMPYLSGGSLQHALKRTPFPVNDVVTYGTQMTDALEYAHKQGVIHRDVKPANMLLHADGRLMLADFGLAKILDGSPRPAHRHGKPDAGTPEYMAPEQIRGRSEPRSDLYGLGVVLYLLLTGRLPFTGGTSEAVMEAHLYREPAPLRSINPRVTPAVEAVVLRALAKQPDDRYQSASEMGAALLEALVAGNAEPLPFASGPSAGSIFSQPSVLPDISAIAPSEGPFSQGQPNSFGPRSGSQGTSATSLLPSLDVPEANSHLSSGPAAAQSSLPTAGPYLPSHTPSRAHSPVPGHSPAGLVYPPSGSVSGFGSGAASSRPIPNRLDLAREHLPTRPLAGSGLPSDVALIDPPQMSLGVPPAMQPPHPVTLSAPLGEAPHRRSRILWIVIAVLLLIMLAAAGVLAYWLMTGQPL